MFRKAVIVPLKIPLTICLSIVSIAGCQSQREGPPSEPIKEDTTVQSDAPVSVIDSARRLLARGDIEAAAAELVRVDIATVVSSGERFEWTILDAEIALGRGALSVAESRAAAAQPTSAAQRAQLALLVAGIHVARSDYASASSSLIVAASAIDDAASSAAAATLVETAWRYAQRVSGHRVTVHLRRVLQPSERAWWQFISAFNDALTTAAQQIAWERWRGANPGHIAARLLPPILVEPDPGPARIALLLPFSGHLKNAGETVRDGFLSAYFLSGAASRQSIHVYDTTAASIAALYRQALDDGADAIVGPLSKEHAADMFALAPTVVTLILNTVGGAEKRAHPMRFALTVEDEARAIATRMDVDGRRRVIVLRSAENWTARAFGVLSDHLAHDTRSEAFTGPAAEGRQPDGTVLVTQLVGSGVFLEGADITSVVGETLLVEASKERRLRLARTIGADVEFTPRRRSDIDAVIALVEGSQLASLRPALAFHFASDLPIYASSQAARDVPNLDDLELLRICDMPWRLHPPKFKSQMREAFPNHRGAADALFAFGLDAYRLINQSSRLIKSADGRIMGSTGILRLGSDGLVQREPVWASVKNGRFVPLAP